MIRSISLATRLAITMVRLITVNHSFLLFGSIRPCILSLFLFLQKVINVSCADPGAFTLKTLLLPYKNGKNCH